MIIPLKPHDFNLMLNLVAHFLLHTLMFIICKIVFWKHDFSYNCEMVKTRFYNFNWNENIIAIDVALCVYTHSVQLSSLLIQIGFHMFAP